jgi:hypothetical protein
MRSLRSPIVTTRVGRVLRRPLCTLIVLCWCVSTAAHAQSALSGIVHDPSSRVAVGAIVVADDGSGTQWKTASNTIGYYEIALPPGEYQVKADLILESGQALIYTGTILVLSNENTALDISLEYRGTDRVTVESAPTSAALLDTHSALGATFSRESLETLPLTNGRTIQSLLSLVPGIIVTDSVGTLAQYTAAGQRRFANRMTIDGMSADLGIEIVGPGIGEAGAGQLPAVSTLGSTQTLVPLAAIEEIQVHTVGASPEQARAPGAQTSIVTRAGSNRYTGSGFADWRPQGLEANDWFVNAGSSPPTQTKFSNIGASFGGPVLKNRLFSFVSWERERIDRAITTTILVPSIETREAASIREGAPPDARAILDAYPLPNGPDLNDGTGLAELTQPFPAASKLNALSVRLDGNLSSQHRLFARINRGTSSGDEMNPDLHLPRMSFTSTEATTTQTATAGLTSVLSASTTHDLKVNFSVNRGSVVATPAPYGNAQSLPLTPFAPAGASASDTWVFIRLFNGPGNVILSGRTSASALEQLEVADTLSHVRGRHTWRFGMDYRRLTMSTDPAPDRYTYSFLNLESFFRGRARQYAVEHFAPAEARFDTWSAFAQDTFRVGPRFSLDYGIRYGVNRAPTSLTDVQPLLVQYETLPDIQFLPTGAPLWKTSWGHVAPRVAATYQLGTASGYETNLRAGWNLVFDDLASPGATAFGSGYPYDASKRIFTLSSFPIAESELTASLPTPLAANDTSQYYAFPRDFRTPRTYSWQVAIEQALGRAQRLGVAYTGAAGRDLVYRQAYYYTGGQLLPLINAYSNDASSDYHALLVEYVRPFSRHFQARLAYTWSHALDTDSGETPPQHTPNLPVTLISPSTNRGSADFDRRHVMQVTGSYRVPTPRASKFVQRLCEDWQIDVVGTVRSGTPFSVEVLSRDFGFGFYDSRPDLTGEPLWITDAKAPGGRRLNANAFIAPTEARQGTLGRNTLRASPLRQLDLALSRSIRLGEHRVVQLRLDAFNVFNLPNFGPPEGVWMAPNFGQSTESYAAALGTGTLQYGGLTPLQQAGGPRSVQVGLRFDF